MTVIIALKDKEKVFLASDSQAITGDIKYKVPKKIFSKKVETIDGNNQIIKKENMYFASTGNAGYSNYIEYGLTLPYKKEDETDEHYLIRTIPVHFMKDIQTNGIIEIVDNTVDVYNWFLIVYNNKIYKMYYNLTVFIVQEDYCVFGSGTEVALGSLYTTQKTKINAKDRIKLAIEACDYHLTSVDNNISIIECK